MLATASELTIHVSPAVAAEIDLVRGLEVREANGAWELRIELNAPARYVGHTPSGPEAEALHISLSLLSRESVEGTLARDRSSVRIPPKLRVPLVELSALVESEEDARLDLRFGRAVRFEIPKAADLRRIIIRVPKDPSAEPAAPAEALVEGPVAALVEEGRQAMTAGDLDRAVQIFTKINTTPAAEHPPIAKELLGVARERKGQLAHAKAEYEEYLEQYPDGEGAARVRQRLDALLTFRAEPASQPSERRRTRRQVRFDHYGSIRTSYLRAERFEKDFDESLLESSSFSDFNLTGRLSTASFALGTQVSGSYRFDFLEDDGPHEFRFSTLQVDIADQERNLFGSFGRQFQSNGGVLGRYDGIRLGYRFLDFWELGAVAGFPVESTIQKGIDTDRYFGGLSLNAGRFFDAVDGQVFAIAQWVEGLIDRVAVGGELRYVQDGRSLVAFVDYDVYFRSLNTALLVGSWQVIPSTSLNLSVDYRNSPVLTTTNALQGQGVLSVDALRENYSVDDIEGLAEDRTGRALTATFGASHQLTERLRVEGDVTVAKLKGTPASGGVEALESSGYELSYFAQLVGTDLLVRGAVEIFGLRYFDGDRADTLTGIVNTRFPIFAGLRMNPILRVSYRNEESGDDSVILLPTLRIDYRVWKFVLDVEAGFEWERPVGASERNGALGYTMNVGIRVNL